MFNKKITPDEIENWKCIYETSIESEAQLVHGFLQDQGLTCEILSKKDTAYNVSFGDLSAIYLYVPLDQVDDAEKSLKEWQEGKVLNQNSDDEDEIDTESDEERNSDSDEEQS